MHKYANPARFGALADRILPWARWVTILALIPGLWLALVASPPDYQQGESVRIMYLHVPAAWMSMFTYMVMAGAAFTALVWRHPLAQLAGRAAAPIGATFTALALVTGSLWGKPMWGTFWVWDGRLTSVLVLFFLYLGYMALDRAIEDEEKAGRAASILALVGVVNIPIIKFSVDWWNTLHQPASVMRMGGSTIDGSMLTPLFIMALAFQAYFVWIFLIRMKLEIDRRKAAVMRQSLRGI
ncbi:heme ABC transporter permease [Gimibacter soli]|uniref:Heme exporter protein C n=1 Tax=Gimibacter soli TaxID=3024400 RepID=A0AAF0BHP1_9PROT|nr:heme ABC transporter permease [Gimibacter soli]WCL54463.1 heme ABC transporter permease [Gimibacter soli]